MRYTTQHLYNINPKEFIGIPYEIVLINKLKALGLRREKLAKELRETCGSSDYEKLCAINYELMYIDGAENDHRYLLDEMGVTYGI